MVVIKPPPESVVTQQVRISADVENVDDLLSPGLTGVMAISPIQFHSRQPIARQP